MTSSFRETCILLIEDNALTRRLVRLALKNEDCQIVEAEDGKTALALLATHRPDLILQDLVLPDMDGFDLVQKLRVHPAVIGMPILAFTGLVSKSDEARFSSAGFDGLITKPVEPSKLQYIVRGHLPVREAQRAPFGKGKRLLVVDDDPVQLELGRERLAKLGFEVHTASDGAEAFHVARRMRPDVIVTDAQMPNLDGFGLCLAIRETPEIADVPIVLVTARNVEAADHELVRRAGANAFVVRSPDLTDVVRELQRVFTPPGAPMAPASNGAGANDSARSSRILRQLERQVTLSAGLVQRCSTLAAELSVLKTVAESLVDARDLHRALLEILASCLDVAGASRGAIFLCAPSDRLVVRAQHGFSACAEELDTFFGHMRELETLANARTMVEASVAMGTGERKDPLGPGSLLVPLVAGRDLLGVMLLDAPGNGLSEDWPVFARAIGSQISLALALGRAFERVERNAMAEPLGQTQKLEAVRRLAEGMDAETRARILEILDG